MSKRSEALVTLRKMTDAEFGQHLNDQRRKLFELRFQQVTGQVENQRHLRHIRKELARTLTVRAEVAAGAVESEAPDEPDEAVAAAPRTRRSRAKAAPAPAVDSSEQSDGDEQ